MKSSVENRAKLVIREYVGGKQIAEVTTTQKQILAITKIIAQYEDKNFQELTIRQDVKLGFVDNQIKSPFHVIIVYGKSYGENADWDVFRVNVDGNFRNITDEYKNG